MAQRIYDHAVKAGNPSDVWKHCCLLTVLDELADPARTFSYTETHAGAGSFVLPEEGEWQRGVGAVVPAPEVLEDHPYLRILGNDLAAGSELPGSWRLVLTRIDELGVDSRIRLFDTSTRVAEHIWAHIERRELPSSLTFQQTDGFAKVSQHEADLTLIDPPYRPARSDWRRVRRAVRHLREHNANYLVWYPLHWPAEPNRLVATADAPGFEIHWQTMGNHPTRTLKGCGILAGGRSRAALEQAPLDRLASALGGRFEIRG